MLLRTKEKKKREEKKRERKKKETLTVSVAEKWKLTNLQPLFFYLNDYLLLPVPTLSKFFFAHTPHNQM